MCVKNVNFRKVAIIGCGFVGSASAFALMQSGLFKEIVLIDVDKKKLREELNHSLDRLYKQNCIDINGDVYCFLTNEEKDIKIEIENNTHVDDSKVLSTIGKIISDVYKSTKINCGKQNFDFDVKVDDVAVGRTGSNMVLQYITNLYGVSPANMLNCDNKVVVHLGQTNYYDLIEKALKIRTFKNKNNIAPSCLRQRFITLSLICPLLSSFFGALRLDDANFVAGFCQKSEQIVKLYRKRGAGYARVYAHGIHA